MKLRLKEMAIRKVLGATLGSTARLFGREYLAVVFAGVAVAVPTVWILMDRWLDNYAYHTSISGLSFVIALSVVLLLMAGTILSEAWRADTKNPADILRRD
jgi:putative ABC transport system permease protein